MLHQELGQTFRNLGKAPGFTALVVGTLALGIAMTTAIFSVVHGVLLRTLPFPDAGRLVRICETNAAVEGFCVGSPPNAGDWARRSRTLEDIGVAREGWFVVEGSSGSEELTVGLATPSFLRLFGAAPHRGRLLEPPDLKPGAPRVVVLTYGFWQSRWGGAPEVLGETLTLDGERHTIVGVLPAELEIPELESAELWLPLPFLQEEYRRWRGFQVIGRLRDGVGLSEARAEMTTVAARLAEEHPETNEGWGIELRPVLDLIVGGVRPTLLVFLGAGGLVLLIGCTNVANLLLFRVLRRDKELAIRAAVGAGRRQLIRLLLVESLACAALGGAVGLALAHGMVKAFLALAPGGIPRIEEVTMDGTVFAFAALLALATSLLFGLAPALRAAKPDLNRTLKGGSQRLFGRTVPELRSLLVVFEVALALIVLIGAGLLIRSFVAAVRWEGGFEHENVMILSVLCSKNEYPRRDDLIHLYQEAVRQLETLPGVLAAGATSAGPLFGGRETGEFFVPNRPGQGAQAARWHDVDPGYFAVVGMKLVKGRYFTAWDRAGAPQVAIVNETMARRFWPDQDPIGQQVRRDRDRPWEVVGLVADVKPFWPQWQTEPEIYWPNLQLPRRATYLVVRVDPTVRGVVEAIEQRLREIAPGMSLGRAQRLEEIVRRRLARPRFNMLLLSTFGSVALLLALGGTYAVISYDVSRRRREIALRMVLGAGPRQIRRRVIARGLKLAALGMALGMAGAFALTKFLTSMLYDVRPMDPGTFGAVIAFLTLAAFLACYLPARRATRVEPITALKWE